MLLFQMTSTQEQVKEYIWIIKSQKRYQYVDA